MRRVVHRTPIVDSFHKPAFCAQVLIEAIECGPSLNVPALFRPYPRLHGPYFHVPFFPCPDGLGPPPTLPFPGAGDRQDLPPHSLAAEKCRLALTGFRRSRKRRPV